MLALAAAFLIALAIAGPLVGHDSRVVDGERHVRWWPGARTADTVPLPARRGARRAHARQRSTERGMLRERSRTLS